MTKLDTVSNNGIKIGGRNINNLRYADDTTILTETENGRRELILRFRKESAVFGLLLNIKKTKIMTTANDGITELKIGNEKIELG